MVNEIFDGDFQTPWSCGLWNADHHKRDWQTKEQIVPQGVGTTSYYKKLPHCPCCHRQQASFNHRQGRSRSSFFQVYKTLRRPSYFLHCILYCNRVVTPKNFGKCKRMIGYSALYVAMSTALAYTFFLKSSFLLQKSLRVAFSSVVFPLQQKSWICCKILFESDCFCMVRQDQQSPKFL